MKISILLLIAFFSIELHAQTEKFEWVKQVGGTKTDIGNAIAIDNKGNVYTTGIFEGSVDFDSGVSSFNLTTTGRKDIFVSKSDASGNFLWVQKMGGVQDDISSSIVVDRDGNAYITGYFSGVNGGEFIPFVLKFDSLGNYMWLQQFPATVSSIANAIAIDKLGNVCVTGHFSGSIEFAGEDKIDTLISAGSSDIFILKINPLGSIRWVKQFKGTGTDDVRSIAVDSLGNMYTTGYFGLVAESEDKPPTDFDPGEQVYTLTPIGRNDIFISKLDSLGNFVWVKSIGGVEGGIGKTIAINGLGNIYISGEFSGVFDFNPGSEILNLTSFASDYNSDIFILKLDSFGNFIWAKQITGTLNEYANSCVVDHYDNLYLTGEFRGLADFNPGTGIFNFTAGEDWDMFITKLDSNGNFNWAYQIGGIFTQGAKDLAIDLTGNIYITGAFNGLVDFNIGIDKYSLKSTDNSLDIFIHKLSQTPTGITEDFLKESLPAFPNPTSDKITLENPFKNSQNIKLQIYTLEGNLLKESSLMPQAKLHIDLSDQPQGTYLLKISSGAESFMAKVNVVK